MDDCGYAAEWDKKFGRYFRLQEIIDSELEGFPKVWPAERDLLVDLIRDQRILNAHVRLSDGTTVDVSEHNGNLWLTWTNKRPPEAEKLERISYIIQPNGEIERREWKRANEDDLEGDEVE